MTFHPNRALWTALLGRGRKTFPERLLARFGESDFYSLNKINADGTFPNLLSSGGATISLISGSVSTTLQPDGSPWLASGAYCDYDISTVNANDSTIIIPLQPDATDLSTTVAYAFRISTNTTVDEVRIFHGASTNQLICNYLGGSTIENVNFNGLTAGETILAIVQIGENGGNNIRLTVNGVEGTTPQAIATDWVSTTPVDSVTTIGAIADAGGSTYNGLHGIPIWMNRRVSDAEALSINADFG